MVNGLLALAISLLFGLPGFMAAAQPAPPQDTAFVQIADSQTPLAGPAGTAAQAAPLHRVFATLPARTPFYDTLLGTVIGQLPSGGSTSGSQTGGKSGVTDPVTSDPTGQPEAPAEEPPAEETPAQEPAAEEPPAEETLAQEPAAEEPPAEETPAEETPAPVTLSAAQRLLERAYALLAQYNAAPTNKDKKEVLGASNFSLSNDAFRKKLLADLGGTWEQLETEVVDATQYQQDKTLYTQVYMSGSTSDMTPVVYATQNADLTGNQWATNLVYDEATGTWMEYVKQHPYNNGRVTYGMTALAKDGTLEELQETMQTSELWAEVVVPETEPEAEPEALAAGAPDGGADGGAADSGAAGGDTDGGAAPDDSGATTDGGTAAGE